VRKSLLSALILLFLGGLLLLNNLGYFSMDLLKMFPFWPVILLFIGLEMLLTKQGSPRLMIAALILVFVLPFFLQGTSLPFNLNFLNFSQAGAKSVTVEKKLGTLIGSKFDFTFKSGSLNLTPLEQTNLLVKGELSSGNLGKEPQVNFDPADGNATMTVTETSGNLPINTSGSNWNLALSKIVPIELVLKAESSKNTFDLSVVRIVRMNLELGATETTLHLGKEENLTGTVKADSGTVTINLPTEKDSKVLIPDSASVDIATRFTKVGEGYQTEGWEKAKDRLEIKVEPGSAKIIIN
jgi:hypothetical protein